MIVDVGNPFSRPYGSLVESLQDSLLLGVAQPATLELIFVGHAETDSLSYPIRGPGPVSGLAAQITGFAGGKPAVFDIEVHYRYSVGQLVWNRSPGYPGEEAPPGWYPDDNSRLTVGYSYRDLPSGITDFNAGSVAGTLVRAVSRELKLLYEQMDQAFQRAFIDYAQGVALDNVVALLGIVRNPALPAQGEVTFSLKRAPRNDVMIPLATRVADARGRLFKVTTAGVIPAVVVENFAAAKVLHVTQAIASLASVQLKGVAGNLVTTDSALGKPFGADGLTVTLAAAPPVGSTVVVSYLAKAPNVTVPVVALDNGPEGNLGSGSLTVMPTPPRGVDGGVTNAKPLTGGEAAEADDPLRERAKHALERAGNATLNAIRFAVLSIDGVDSVEVSDFSVDSQIPLGEVRVLFSTGKPEIEDDVKATVDKTRAAGIRANVKKVSTVTLSGQFLVIPDVAGAGKEAFARYKTAVVKALNGLGIGEPVSARKLSSLVFQVAGLADVGEAQLNADGVPVTTDPFLIQPGAQVRPDEGAISVLPLQALAVSNAKLTGGNTLACTVAIRDDADLPVTLRNFKLALTVSVRGRPTAAPSQSLQQVGQTTGTVTFTNASSAAATFATISIPGLAGLEAASLQVMVQASAYPGMRGGPAPLALA